MALDACLASALAHWSALSCHGVHAAQPSTQAAFYLAIAALTTHTLTGVRWTTSDRVDFFEQSHFDGWKAVLLSVIVILQVGAAALSGWVPLSHATDVQLGVALIVLSFLWLEQPTSWCVVL